MPLLPRKPAQYPKLSDMVYYTGPQHDAIGKREKHGNAKALFEALLLEAKDG